MIFRSFDFETTGFPEEGNPAAVLEAGWSDVIVEDDGSVLVTEPRGLFVNPFRDNPELEIAPSASAAHHLIKSDIDLESVIDVEEGFLELAGSDISAYACHNLSFDGQFWKSETKPMICTLRCARRLWPDLSGHSNQVIRYSIPAIRDAIDRTIAKETHRAAPDAYVTAHILSHMIVHEGASLDDLIEFTEEPMILSKMPFGKHRGQLFSKIPSSYLDWLSNQSDLDDDLKFTIDHYKSKNQIEMNISGKPGRENF